MFFSKVLACIPKPSTKNPQNSLKNWSRTPCRVVSVLCRKTQSFRRSLQNNVRLKSSSRRRFWLLLNDFFLKLFATSVFFCDFRCYVIHTSIQSIYLWYKYKLLYNVYIYICIVSYIRLYIHIYIYIYIHTEIGREGIFMSVSGVSSLVKNVSYCHMCTSTYIAHTFFT